MHLGRSLLVITFVCLVCFTARGQNIEESEAESFEGNPAASYSERRSTIGTLLSFGYSAYNPNDYRPDFVVNRDYNTYYDSPETPLLEATLGVKLNFLFLSVSVDLGAGYFSNQGQDSAKLDVTPVRLGGTLSLDKLFSEPYIVPYVSVGAYSAFYKESLASQSVSGRTSPALYYAFGGRFQLDWLDDGADRDSYEDFGIENTFIYVEARSFGASSDTVPDLSSPATSPLQFGAGLALEL